jgi:uncharacterized FAD-dependent dehydrogenase
MRTVVVQLPIDELPPPGEHDPRLLDHAARLAKLTADEVSAVVLKKRSVDLRKRRQPKWVLVCDVYTVHERPPDLALPPLIRPKHIATPHDSLRPIIVGMGPAGLFAALVFADHGLKVTIIERGARVETRNIQVRDLRAKGVLNPESNLCFGEGGAGTYSDGKLYTRKKTKRVREVYQRLVALGISERILIDAHPHVGTNRLIPMARRLRDALEEAGHTLLFDAKVTDLVVGSEDQVEGVVLADGREVRGGPVLLATGHSARDTYEMLAARGVAMERKPFAIGARIEHPQALVDEVQLGPLASSPHIGHAEYFVRQKVETSEGDRGVYSFCMCPGGYVMLSPTETGHLNVNGMSNSNRGSHWANAALVRQVEVDDFYLNLPGDLDHDPRFGAHVANGALTGLALQGVLERRAFAAGGGDYRAPAQRLVDLIAGRTDGDLPATSYRPGVQQADTRAVLGRFAHALVAGAQRIESRQLRGYTSREAVVIPVETTTSSPVRVLRGRDMQSVTHPGLYPVAEGAGYAGGIVSSAIDGMRAAETVLEAAGVSVLETPVV